MWGNKKKNKGTYTEPANKITEKENQIKADKSKDKGNNGSVADLRNIKKSKWV